MKLIIDIPEDYYEIIKYDVDNHLTHYRPFEIIANGIPLPKGHGRLIDADELYDSLIFPNSLFGKAFKEILDDAPTIIEAESEE